MQDPASIDRLTFHRYFDDANECFSAVWAEANPELIGAMTAAFDRPGPWREQIRATLAACLGFLAARESPASI